MKIGISMPHSGFLTERGNITSIASKADILGFDFLTVSDHIVIPKYVESKMPYAADGAFNSGDGFCYDPLTLLSFLSAVTETIRLVPSVMVVPYRNPIYAAKMISTIDVLSSGRITIGCGIGWLKEEFEVLDAHDFHSRGIVTNEYIESMIELWTQSLPSYRGEYIQFQNILFTPKPIQKPHPPIWIGGESEAAIKRAARIGNGWFPLSQNPTFPLKTNEQLNLSLGRLKKELDLRNKNIDGFDVVFQPGWANLSEYNINMINDNSSHVTENILELERLGVTHVLFYFPKIEVAELHDVLENFADKVLNQLS
tara:strand:- start:69 stop:1004 length:936 start_codon:yes stop_codon:yes gene_type:complete